MTSLSDEYHVRVDPSVAASFGFLRRTVTAAVRTFEREFRDAERGATMATTGWSC